MAYKVSGEEHLFDWLSREPDPRVWDAVLAWVRDELARRPFDIADVALPGGALVVYLSEFDVAVTYAVMENLHEVHILRAEPPSVY